MDRTVEPGRSLWQSESKVSPAVRDTGVEAAGAFGGSVWAGAGLAPSRSAHLLTMEELGGVFEYSLVGPLPKLREDDPEEHGVVRLLLKALLLRDGRTFLRGMLYYEQMADVVRDRNGVAVTPARLAALPLELRLWDATEPKYGDSAKGLVSAIREVPSRRLELYARTCAYGETSVAEELERDNEREGAAAAGGSGPAQGSVGGPGGTENAGGAEGAGTAVPGGKAAASGKRRLHNVLDHVTDAERNLDSASKRTLRRTKAADTGASAKATKAGAKAAPTATSKPSTPASSSSALEVAARRAQLKDKDASQRPTARGSSLPSHRGVARCRDPTDPAGSPERFESVEFRVDLGSLGQHLSPRAARTGAWLSVVGWPQGIDLSDLIANPEVADVGSVLDDRGERDADIQARRKRLTMTEDNANWGTASAATCSVGSEATAWFLPRSTAEDPLHATLTPQQAMFDACKHSETSSSPSSSSSSSSQGGTPAVSARDTSSTASTPSPASPPTPAVVQVWMYLYWPKPFLEQIVARLVEHAMLSGASGVMAYVTDDFGERLLEHHKVSALVAAGRLALVRWRSLARPPEFPVYEHGYLNAHAILSHWGRNVWTWITDVDELLALPPRDPAAEAKAKRHQETARKRGETVAALGPYGGGETRTESGAVQIVDPEALAAAARFHKARAGHEEKANATRSEAEHKTEEATKASSERLPETNATKGKASSDAQAKAQPKRPSANAAAKVAKEKPAEEKSIQAAPAKDESMKTALAKEESTKAAPATGKSSKQKSATGKPSAGGRTLRSLLANEASASRDASATAGASSTAGSVANATASSAAGASLSGSRPRPSVSYFRPGWDAAPGFYSLSGKTTLSALQARERAGRAHRASAERRDAETGVGDWPTWLAETSRAEQLDRQRTERAAAETSASGAAKTAATGSEAPSGSMLPSPPAAWLSPLTPRQRRLANAFVGPSCAREALRRQLAIPHGSFEHLHLRSPQCASINGLVTYAGLADPEALPDGELMAREPDAASSLRAPHFLTMLHKRWRKPALNPDAVAGTGVHTGSECVGGRTQPWGRPAAGGRPGPPRPLERGPDGRWLVEQIGLPLDAYRVSSVGAAKTTTGMDMVGAAESAGNAAGDGKVVSKGADQNTPTVSAVPEKAGKTPAASTTTPAGAGKTPAASASSMDASKNATTLAAATAGPIKGASRRLQGTSSVTVASHPALFGAHPPAVTSACRMVRECVTVPDECLQQRHLVNLHGTRRTPTPKDERHDEWLWVYDETDVETSYPDPSLYPIDITA